MAVRRARAARPRRGPASSTGTRSARSTWPSTRADDVAGDRHPLEQQRRVPLHQVLVDVGAGVALVAVDDDELRRRRGVPRELPLHPRGEARAAAAAQVRRLHLFEHRFRGQLGERATQARPVAGLEQHRLVERALPLRLGRLDGRAGEDALERVRPGVDDVALAERRARVAEAEADRLLERDRAVLRAAVERRAELRLEPRDLRVELGRPARRAGAHADVPLPARLDEVVVEASRRRRRSPRAGRSAPRPVGGRRPSPRRVRRPPSCSTSSAVRPSPSPCRFRSSIRLCDISRRHYRTRSWRRAISGGSVPGVW